MVQPSFVDSRGVSIRVFSGNTITNDLNVTNDFTLGSAFYFCAPDIAEEVDFDGGLNMVINSLETRLIPLPFESFNTEVIYPIPQEYQNLGLPLRFAFSMSEVINFEVWLLLPIDPCVTENNENQDILEFIISLVATGVTGAAQVLIPNPLGALLATTLIRGVPPGYLVGRITGEVSECSIRRKTQRSLLT